MLPLLLATLIASNEQVPQRDVEGRIAVITWSQSERKGELQFRDSNGKLVESYPLTNSYTSFRIIPGKAKLLATVFEVTRPRKPGSGNIPLTSGVLYDYKETIPSSTLYDNGFFEQGLPNQNGTAIYVTEREFDKANRGFFINKSWLVEPATKKKTLLPLSGQQHIQDISHDGKSALVSHMDKRIGKTYDIISTSDWKTIAKGVETNASGRLSPDGQSIVTRESMKFDRDSQFFLVVRKTPFRDKLMIDLSQGQTSIHEFSLSPDGKRIAFTAFMKEPDDKGPIIVTSLYLANLDGTNIKLIHRCKNGEVMGGIDWR